jgi:hypothetical protein
MNVMLGFSPKTAPKGLRFSLDFTEALSLTLDALNDKINGNFGTPQAVFVDNTANAGIFKLTAAGLDLPVYLSGGAYGMLPFPVSEKFRASAVHQTANAHVDLWFFNVPQPYFVHVPVA